MGWLRISYQLNSSSRSSSDGDWTIFTSHLCCLLGGEFVGLGSSAYVIVSYCSVVCSFFEFISEHYFFRLCALEDCVILQSLRTINLRDSLAKFTYLLSVSNMTQKKLWVDFLFTRNEYIIIQEFFLISACNTAVL